MSDGDGVDSRETHSFPLSTHGPCIYCKVGLLHAMCCWRKRQNMAKYSDSKLLEEIPRGDEEMPQSAQFGC